MGWLRGLPGKAVESAAGYLLVLAVIVVGTSLAPLLGGLKGQLEVPVWIAVAAAGIALVTIITISLLFRRQSQSAADDVIILLNYLDEQEALGRYYAQHLYEALQTLRKAITGEIPGVTYGDFIHRGILEPARDWLTQGEGEEIRLSILVPDKMDHEFRMKYSAGHSLESHSNYKLAIAGSFAGNAYGTGDMNWSNDLDQDSRYKPHPKALPGREYQSIVSVPIMLEGSSVAVFNVISTLREAFSITDRDYIELLASIVNVTWSMAKDSGQGA